MKRLIKLMSIALCLAIVLSSALATVFALSVNGHSLGSADEPEKEADLYKDESVYVMAQADGTVDKIIVSDWIRNNTGAATITDLSAVDDIENVKTDASYTLDSNNMRVWDANGEDLYLEGEGRDPLPVELGVTYTLDGKVIDPADLAGRSGKVTIRFDYTNNRYETVEIDGQKERIYVPFMMLTGLLLDSDKFSNVKVTNGKIVSDGDRTIVAGIAFPGLQHDLGLKQSEIDIPDYIEVSADVEDFALSTTVTMATNGLVNKLNPDDIDSFDELKDSLGELESAMSQLIDGSSKLYDGLSTLLEKSDELAAGIDQLYAGGEQLASGADKLEKGSKDLADGAEQLKDGTGQLKSGTGQLKSGSKQLSAGTGQLKSGAGQLDAGTGELSQGLSSLTQNNTALTEGSDATFASILTTAHKQLTDAGLDVPELTADNYAAVLDAVVDSLSEDSVRAQATDKAKEQVTAAVEANRGAVESAVTAAVRDNVEAEVTAAVKEQITAAVLAQLGYTTAEYSEAVANGLVDEATRAQVNAAIDSKMADSDTLSTITSLTDQQMQNSEVQAVIDQNTQAQIDALIEQNMQGGEVQTAIAEAIAKAAAARDTIRGLKAQLDAYNTFNTGLKTYTSGVASASDGAKALKSATSQLNSGAGSVDTGAIRLNAGAIAVDLGAVNLDNGAAQLKDGTAQLNRGAAALSNGADTLLDGLLTLKNGVPALKEGVGQLKSGSMQLSDGLKEFNERGISKIVSLLGDDLGGLATRLKATVEVSKNYKSYSGLADGMDGEVKFIYKTEEI